MSNVEWFVFGAVVGGGTVSVAVLFWLDAFLRKYEPVQRRR